MTATFAAATASDSVGWGHPIALILAALVFWLVTAAHKRWKQVKDLPSPKAEKKAISTVTPALTADSAPDSGLNPGGGEVVLAVPPAAVATDAGYDEEAVRAYLADRIGTQPTTALVRTAAADLGVSETSVWRVLRRVRADAESGVA